MLTAGKLTRAERLLLQRRRRGLTKAEAAERHGVSLYRYERWEAGETLGAPLVGVGRLAFREASLIMRLRAGVGLGAFAGLLGCSGHWVTRMEAGEAPDDRLRAFWRDLERPRARQRRRRSA